MTGLPNYREPEVGVTGHVRPRTDGGYDLLVRTRCLTQSVCVDVAGPPRRVVHRLQITFVAKCRGTRGKANENLAGVEGDGPGRVRPNNATLESAIGTLDAHQPVQHPPTTRQQAVVTRASGVIEQRRNHIAGRLCVRGAPTSDQ